MGVFTLHGSNIKGFAFEFARACPVWIGPDGRPPHGSREKNPDLGPLTPLPGIRHKENLDWTYRRDVVLDDGVVCVRCDSSQPLRSLNLQKIKNQKKSSALSHQEIDKARQGSDAWFSSLSKFWILTYVIQHEQRKTHLSVEVAHEDEDTDPLKEQGKIPLKRPRKQTVQTIVCLWDRPEVTGSISENVMTST